MGHFWSQVWPANLEDDAAHLGPVGAEITGKNAAAGGERQKGPEYLPTCPEFKGSLALAHTGLVALRVCVCGVSWQFPCGECLKRTLMQTGMSGKTRMYLRGRGVRVVSGSR